MIPATYPSTLITGGGRAINVQMIYSITGQVRWVDYIPVKFVGTATDNYAEAGGLSAINQLTGFNWTDFIKCYEDTAATKPWKCEADGYIPLYQYDGFYSFFAPLKTSIALSKGTGTATFTRADATECAIVTDFEGVIRTVPANCARFQGARMVRNLILKSNAFTTAPWSATLTPSYVQNLIGPDGVANSGWTSTDNDAASSEFVTQSIVLPAATTVYSIFVAKTVGAQASYPVITTQIGGAWWAACTVDTSNGVATVWASTTYGGYTVAPSSATCISWDANWWRVSLTVTGIAGTWAFAPIAAGALTANKSSGQLDGTAQGSAGFANAQLENVTGQSVQTAGEYVSVGVLSSPYHGAGVDGIKYFDTKLDGTAISSTTLLGYLAEGSRQNILLNSLLDGTNLGTQVITVTAAPWTVSFTGTGTITFSGAYVGSLVGTGATDRVQKTFTPTAGALTCTVSGTVKWAQAELGSFASTYIPTAATAVTKTLEVDSYPTASNITAATGSIYLEFTPNHAPSGTIALWGAYVDASNYTAILHDATNIIFRKRIAGVNYDSTLALAFVSGTTYKVAASWSASNSYIAASGTAGAGSGNGTAAQISATQQIGADGNGGQQPFAEIKNNYIWTTALTSAQLASITA